MTSRDFCYWLQGFIELTAEADLRDEGLRNWQLEKVQNHLAMVFKHEIDPSFGGKNVQDALSKIHSGAISGSIEGMKLNC